MERRRNYVPRDPIMTDEELDDLYHQEIQPPQMYYEFCEAPNTPPEVSRFVRRVAMTVVLLAGIFVVRWLRRFL